MSHHDDALGEAVTNMADALHGRGIKLRKIVTDKPVNNFSTVPQLGGLIVPPHYDVVKFETEAKDEA